MAAIQFPSRTKLEKSEVPLKPKRVTPSAYTQKMLQPTEERLANTDNMCQPHILELFDMSKTAHHKPLFQPYPSELVFQNFTPAQTYTSPLLFHNKDKVPRQVRLEQQQSEYFHVVGPEDARSRVAPGLSTTFSVCFTPQENKDYHHRLVCVTDRERFEVPVRAIGPRAILDFRDEVHLPVCPVKATTEKTQLISNIGNSKAKFKLETQSPFSVTPSLGTLDVGENMQVTVYFHPMTVGVHSQELLLHYHTGEDVYIGLHGACEELNVCLEADSVLLSRTYISLASVHTVSLTYKSEIPLKYYWTTWPSLQEEALSLLRETSVLPLKELEGQRERLLVQCESDPTAIHQLPLLSRALQERRSQVVKDYRLALSHSCTTVEPAEGEIWPRCPGQFTIVFKPQEAKLYEQTIYCDITGREARLPLTIKAEGMGPNLYLIYELIDMQNIYIGEKDVYEVQFNNRGLIDAPFRLSSPDTTFGRCFSFSPEEGVVPSGACQIVKVTFHSCILGTFSEDLLLTATGQPEPLTVTFRGCVIGPTFHFNISELNFGDVAFGFPVSLTCTLHNTSYVSMTFALRVLGDGLGSPSITSDEQASEVSRNNWGGSTAGDLHARPVEFTITPAAGSMQSLADVTIKVTLCSNTVKTYRLALAVDVEGAGEEIMTLPINARCIVPNIVVDTPALDFQRCFLNYPYEHRVRLTNTSALPACIGMLDQEAEDSPSLIFRGSSPRGLILPHSSGELTVFLMAKAIGRQQHTLRIAVFGSVKPPLEVVLSCFGQGPIVHVQSPRIDFGTIPVLTDVTRALLLSNQSPIPAHFTACMSHGRSFGRVEPSEGEVPPESELELRVVAHLKDTLHFQVRLEVSIRDSRDYTVLLSATGTGTTIVSDRPFAPNLDLGAYLSHMTCQYKFKLTNQGQRTYRMYWRTDGFLHSGKIAKRSSFSGQPVLPPISAPKKKGKLSREALPSSTEEKPVFNLRPSRVELTPGSSVDMVLTGSSDSPKLVQEHLLCHAIVGGQGCSELIMSVDVTCRFVAPVLNISSKQLKFYLEKVPGQSLTPLYDKLILENVSSLSLSVELSLVEPFSLCEAEGAYSPATTKSMVLGVGEQPELWVCFNPTYCQDRVSRVEDKVIEIHYQGHPQLDTVELHAEVHFPNLKFSTTAVDFGCVPNCTGTRQAMLITNCSPMPVYYHWVFLADEENGAIRETGMLEAEREPINETEEEGWRSPRIPSPLSPVLSADEPSSAQGPVSVQEVFDILPIHGHLQPGEQQQVTLSFYGHENVSREVVAQCRVEEGPAYEIQLKGEASVVNYSLNSTRIDFGLQLFDHEGEAEVILRNNGKMGFEFSILPPQNEDEEAGRERKAVEEVPNENEREVVPGRPMVIPATGYIYPGAEQCLRVLYIPGLPEAFEKQLQLQVAYLPLQVITLTGEGVFPRICLNLPQNLSKECYSDAVQQARTALKEEELKNDTDPNGGSTTEANRTLTYEKLLHMEVERILVKQNALAVTDGSLLERKDSQGSSRKWSKLSQFPLPEYVLDFGYVIPGNVVSHTVNVANNGLVPVSFHGHGKPLARTGFSTDIEKVKNLPCGDTQSFTVKFAPQSATPQMGPTSVVMPIQVVGGPMVQVRLCAVVTVPAIIVSTDALQFDTMPCGMCQMRTIQLFNPGSVPCCWSIAEKGNPLKKRTKDLQKQQPPPAVFKGVPSSGKLSPGERVNVQIKFSPAEGHLYNRQLLVSVAESSQQVIITVEGQGEEPHLEFDAPVLELGPGQPVSNDIEAEVTVKNQCSFPIEFYCLEFDTQYLDEEKILRLMQGYDENNILLLPPRTIGESLPTELLDYYQERCSQLKNDAELKEGLEEEEAAMGDTYEEGERSKPNNAHSTDSKVEEMHTFSVKPAELFVSEMYKEGGLGGLEEVEMTPVTRAIARYMCVDLSHEGLAAFNRRGIAVIVYGAPLTDKGSTVAALTRHYGGACLSVDAVVKEALMNATSPVGLAARKLYDDAAADYAKTKPEEAAQTTEPGPAADLESSEQAPHSTGGSRNALEVFSKPSEDSFSGNDSKSLLEAENTPFTLCLGGDVTTLSNLLPDQLLVDILAERFQLSDCHRGIVIDGLESVFSQSAASTLQIVLKALNNRKHIFFVTLSDSYAALKEREKAQREAEEALHKEKADREEQWLQELDEEEYDALPEVDQKRIFQRMREKRRMQNLRELEHVEQEKKRLQEEMDRLREEESKKKSTRSAKKEMKEMLRKKSTLEGKQSADTFNGRRMTSSENYKELPVDEVTQSRKADDLQKQTEESKAVHAESPQPSDQLEREKSIETAEMKRLREEKELKKSKKGGERDNKEASVKRGPSGGKEATAALDASLMSVNNNPKGQVDAKEQHNLNEDASRQYQSKEADHSQKKTREPKGLQIESPPTEKLEAFVDELQSQFSVYEQSQEQIEHILHHWDRARGLLLVPLHIDEAPSALEDAPSEKQTAVGKRSKKASCKIMSPMYSHLTPADAGHSHDIIPHIVLNATGKNYPSDLELFRGSTLPSLVEVLDDLGLGPNSLSFLPPTTFSLVPFPKNREQSNSQLNCSCFTFLIPSGLEEPEMEKKDLVEDVQASAVKAAAGTISKGRSVKESVATKDKGRESQKSKRQTTAKKKANAAVTVSTVDCSEQNQHQENLELKRNQSLTTYRWVVPANGEVNIKVWFYSDTPGKFEQTFNFELMGTQRQYQLLCRGISVYPSICKDYMTLFANSKKVPQMKEVLQKTYAIKPGYFEFGPLLCGKTRDRYKENRYPENMERLVIHNNSSLEAEVQFYFQHDSQAATYLLDPPTMTLKPDQIQELTVWAYPTQLGQMKDSIVCQIKDNPELVIINLSCWGIRPELELESKSFNFKRTLLDRQESRSLTLHNRTVLPVSWRLQGVEELGDEFSVPQDEGIISPNSSFSLNLHFRPKRPLNIMKILHLEVSDVEMILGIVHTENIQVTAEAFDIILNITPDGCLDFGTIKVFEEAKLSLRMKNQGKYELAFKFTLKKTDPNQPNLHSIFTVSPMSGTLMPHEKPTIVQIICRPKKEVLFREQAILPCKVIEPSIGNGGETVAILANKVSVKSVFSRYKITPACDLNFGPLVCACKKSQSFTIENNGDFEIRFSICCTSHDPVFPGKAGAPGRRLSIESHSERLGGASSKVRRDSTMSVPQVSIQNRLIMGVFSLSPSYGNLQPGSQQVVTVECTAEQLGNWKQGLLIDVSHRDPSDHPDGIPYRLLAEICKPGIALDMASIFEEHHLCTNSSQLSSEQFLNAESIYVQDQNQFMFNKVIVGRTAQARFKLTNDNKVPCVLSMAIKYVGAKISRSVDVFDLSATVLSIPSQSHSFVVVNFVPQTVQLYSAVFEATMEVNSRMTPTFKSKVLEFNIMGEGNLPNISVVHPALRNSRGNPMLQFTHVLVGRKQTRPLVLLNYGKVPAQVQIDMLDKHGVFTLKAAPGLTSCSINSTQIEGPNDLEHHLVHRAVLRLDVNEQAEFEVSFCSDKPMSVKANMSLNVEDNQYDKTQILVTGETYQNVVSLDNIRQSSQEIYQVDEEGGNYVVLNFGDCHVDCPSQESFTMINHSRDQVVRFEWPPVGSHVFFSPQVGHLHAGCSKEVTVTFETNQPVTLTNHPIRCKVSQVEFQEPLDQVADWDDRQRTLQWLNSSNQASEAPLQPVKNKTDPEPCCSVVEGSQWELELRICAVCDYVKFSCLTNTINFKDTLLYQTRLHQLQIVNHGTVKLEYSWQVLMDKRTNIVNRDLRDGTLTVRRGSRSVDVLTRACRASVVPGVMSPLTENPELPPISVEPSIGTVAPGATQDFKIRFSPREVAQFQGRLVSSIPNLQIGHHAPCVSVCGRSELPHCHFDLEVSDYISGNRRNPDFKIPLDPNTRVVEFNSVGISVPSTRNFSVVNPTSKPYSFKWRCEDTDAGPFSCLNPRGTILPGSQADVCFEYVAEQLETVESLWSFTIETLSLTFPFLCVATTKEPLVYLDRPLLNFGELLVGRKVEQTVDLVNGEEESFRFSVVQSSLLCDDQQSSLTLQPMAGIVAPRDRLPLSVSFSPCREGYVSFRLVLRVKRKSEQLALTVKADCFIMSTSVQVEKPEGGLKEISPNHKDTLDFGKVWISEQSTVNLLVSNLARFRLEVNFDLMGPSELLQYLEAKPQNKTIEVGKQLGFSLFFCPRSICNLQDVRLSIKVKHGPTFTFAIEGRAVAPRLEFSFTKHNFGKCFVYSPGMVPASQTLVISNKGERDISVKCQFRNTSYFEMDFQPNTLSPGAMMKAPVTFYPREACRYQERLSFVLNGCVTRHVDMLGQGVEMKLEVENPEQRKVKLGFLMLGQKVKKQVVLVNRSPLDLSFTLLLNTNTPLAAMDLSVSPAGELNLKARVGSCNVEIQFSPRQQIPPFTAELQAEFTGLLHPLLTIQGCCQSVEVQLDHVHLSFGAVVQRCKARKRIVMNNTGDIGARFEWKTENFPPELSITPANGYISPGTKVPFQVTFSPVELINDTTYENLSCCVEGFSSPVTFNVTGSCVVASTSKEAVNFVCQVRSSHTQAVSVFNPTNQPCSIRPIIEGEQWSADTSVILEALQNKTCKITYRPLTMTTDGKKHLGSVFFSFPDGTGTLYSLIGTAEPPKAKDTIVQEMPAKTLHTELLPVHNWLSKPQRFHVLMEILKPDKPDATVSLKGLEYFDVPALASRDYSMSFFTYREGQYNIKVTFRNEGSGEYLFYLVNLKATPPGVLSIIELVTTVHRTASATVQVENPLNTVTCLNTECKCLEISAPLQHTVPGQSQSSLSFEYQPMRAGESTVRLTLHSNDLGYFHYDLLLRALPAPPEKTVHFNTSLGCSHSVFVKFTNYARLKTEYTGKTDCPDFTVGKAKPQVGSEVSMDVCFEPHQLGEVKGQLTVSSAVGGDYIFPLNGICLHPEAQGPISIRTGRSISIPFKNVLLQTTTFSFTVDNPCFTVKELDTIHSKKILNIQIFFEAPPGGSPGPWFGRLTISNQRSEARSKIYSWVYYLRGHRSDTS